MICGSMSAEERQALLLIVAATGPIVVLLILWLLLMREQVKKSLRASGLTPTQVRWRPFAYWAGVYSTAFRVIYLDPLGLGHRARCRVSRLDLRVKWIEEDVAYLSTDLPFIGRFVYIALAVLLVVFGLHSVVAGKLVLPPTLRHPGPLVIHGKPLALLVAAALCGAANLLMASVYGYAGRGRESAYTFLARGFSAIGWCLFLVSFLVYAIQGAH